MTDRPYLDLGIEALEHLARLTMDDPGIMEGLLAELSHRRLPRAQRLKARLEAEGKKMASGDTDVSETATDRSLRKDANVIGNDANCEVQGDPGPSPGHDKSLTDRYESLRSIITVEAELLARWGMTPSLPHDLQDLVFEAWSERLRRVPTAAYPTLEKMAEDRKRIAEERAFTEDALNAHGLRVLRPAQFERLELENANDNQS